MYFSTHLEVESDKIVVVVPRTPHTLPIGHYCSRTHFAHRPQQPTQGPHRPSTKSQISPTTQTPSSCLSEEEGGRFAFGLGAAARGAAAAAPTAAGSQTSGIGLSGGILGRDGAGDERGGGGGCSGQGRGDRLTVLSMELHVQVGASRRPDPRRDSVHAVCWKVKDAFTSAERETVETTAGVIVLPLSTAAARRPVVAGDRSSDGAGRGSGGGGGGKTRDSLGDSGSGSSGSGKEEVCLKCGERRDDEARAFCTFEGGGFLGQGCRGAGDGAGAGAAAGLGLGRGTFCHGLGKDVEVVEVCSEEQVFRALVGVFCRHDPDFVVGWEVQGDSLGYVVERGLNMVSLATPNIKHQKLHRVDYIELA